MINTYLFYGPVAITLALGVIIILIIYRSKARTYSYWKKRGIPSVDTVPFLGSILNDYGKNFHKIEEQRYKKLGRIYGHYSGSNPLLSIGEPALIRNVLVKDFGYFHNRTLGRTGSKVLDEMLSAVQGDTWKRIRSIISPTFSTGKIKRMLNIFKECSRTLDQNIKTAIKDGKFVEMKRLYEAFAMDVIANSAFSTKIDSHNDPQNKFVQMAKRTSDTGLSWRFLFYIVAPRLMRLLKVSVLQTEPLDFFVNVTHQIVEERRKSGKSRNDFLQLLLDTAKEVSEEEKWDTEDKNDIASNYAQNEIEQQILKTTVSKRLSMDELVSQCVLFFTAGYHTTASTLACATYSLALNPEIQDKLRKEVDDVLKDNKGDMTYEAIQSMKYLDNIISETLRVYSPAIRLSRVANADYELGDTGITIPKGMGITVPIYAMLKDPEFYPEPEKFDPDRFSSEEKSNRDLYTYLPFGVGPRNCVGMRFALIEIKVGLAHVVANFNIKRCPETKVPLERCFGLGLIKPNDIKLEMEVRKDSPLAL